ncbi:hypothetical protein FRC11_003790, partial [Ceratobasidium sp. 423]
MSEEQKYHKSVYQEPRVTYRDKQGRGRGRGQRGGRGGRGGGRSSYAGSGENAIPLGPQTNAWTAPPPDPVNNEPFNSNEWTANGDKTSSEAQPPTTNSSTGGVPEPDKKSKKSKKRKAEEVDNVEPAPAASATEEPAKKKKKKQADEPTAESATDAPAQPETKDKKKKKSRKSEAENGAASTIQNGTTNLDTTVTEVESAPTEKEKKGKKSKKSHKSETAEEAVLSGAVDGHSTTESNGDVPTTVPLATFVNNNALPPTNVAEGSPSGKKSTSEEEAVQSGTSNGVGSVNGHSKSEKKEKSSKRDKKGKKGKEGKEGKPLDGVDEISP